MPKQTDNRMGWIRNIEALRNKPSSEYTAEYEIASECHIPGVLNYMDGAILCGLMTLNKDSTGLYKYLLRIKYPYNDQTYSYNSANKKGYLFPEGIPGELISIMSLFFQSRFFLLAAYTGELSPASIKTKIEYAPQIKSCRPYFDPDTLISDKRNFAIGLVDFLDKLSDIKPIYHQELIIAFYNYARALREFGIDEEMVFIRLVSSIESFSGRIQLSNKQDLFSGIEFEEIIQTDRLSAHQQDELNMIFSVRKAKARFRTCIERYSKGFFTGGNFKAKQLRIKKADLPKTLDAIYDSRSGYLHRGEPMYLSRHMKGGQNWDIDPTAGMIIDNRLFSSKKKLPYSSFFQRLVRHCIMNFVAEISEKANS